MSPAPTLTAPGSAQYNSKTMHVGDGTWDSSTDTFLLPNLMGLNFATMRYNGMGNRFKDMAHYKSIVTGHGVIAAITFLAVVPAAIFIARFYHRNPRLALRMHIWLQILTLLLTTVVFVLGWFAVGPSRSLTNPHHGIGLAIYVLIFVQAIGGGLIHHFERGKERYRIPLKLILHQWLGRTVALLGFIQIPLGLTLWGSPEVLFILYAIWGAFLLLLYFVLEYRTQPAIGFHEDGSTYLSDVTTESPRSHYRHRGLGAAAASGAAVAALRRHSRSRDRRRGDTDVSYDTRSRRRSDSFSDDEKYTDITASKKHTWRDRMLEAGVGLAAFTVVKKLFGRRKTRDDITEVSTYTEPSTVTRPTASGYTQPTSGVQTVSQTDISRVEEGRVPVSPDHYRRAEEQSRVTTAPAASTYLSGSPRRPSRRRSGDSVSSLDDYSDYTRTHTNPGGRPHSPFDEEGEGHGARNTLAALGLVGFLKHKWNQRKHQTEERHVAEMREHDRDNERVARMNSQRRRFTGDGAQPPRRHRRHSSFTEDSAITGSTPGLGRPATRPPPPFSTSDLPPSRTEITRTDLASTQPRTDMTSHLRSEDLSSPPPVPYRQSQHKSSRPDPAAAAGAAAGLSPSQRPGTADTAPTASGIASPPVSVKIKMHNDGRHVTLRRLNEEEAAAEREARRKERRNRKRNGSLSSSVDNSEDRWRRVEAMEAAQAQGSARPYSSAGAAGPSTAPPPPPPHGQENTQPYFPPPPPIPATNQGGAGSISSPPATSAYDTGTEMSAYDSNRRRRRAERAQARMARAAGAQAGGGAGTGSKVEFT